jgi:signal transduction histidine kinase
VANLLENALRPGGGPITVSAIAAEGRVEIHIADAGPDFPPQSLPRAFDRFTRADSAHTGAGTGLGPAILAAIVRSHGGSAQARNLPGGVC